jgi:hypothetical protein
MERMVVDEVCKWVLTVMLHSSRSGLYIFSSRAWLLFSM